MTLTNLSEAELIASAGGDPWAINQSLQAGSPFQISQLAEAFHGAGRHTAEADHAFEQARKRFAAAWNHQDGGHPSTTPLKYSGLRKPLGSSLNSCRRSVLNWKRSPPRWPMRRNKGLERSPFWTVSSEASTCS